MDTGIRTEIFSFIYATEVSIKNYISQGKNNDSFTPVAECLAFKMKTDSTRTHRSRLYSNIVQKQTHKFKILCLILLEDKTKIQCNRTLKFNRLGHFHYLLCSCLSKL